MQSLIPIELKKRPSVLDGLTLLEMVPEERIRALLKSPFLLQLWGKNDNKYEQKYSNEEQQIKAYLQKYNKPLQGVPVTYKKPKHGWGRSFPEKSLGLSLIRRETRNTLIFGLYYDIDLKNAQPNIIKNICEDNSIPCPIISHYCDNREEILQDVQERYNVDRKKAKDLFIRICFNGSYIGWCLKNNISGQAPLDFITLFERELKDIAEEARKECDELYESARQKKTNEGQGTDKKILGSFFALYNQEYESRIVERVLCYVMNQTDLMKVEGTNIPVGTYEYDGIKLLKENVDRFDGGLNGLVELLNEKTFELTGFNLTWEEKELDDRFDIDEWIEMVIEEEAPDANLYEVDKKIRYAIKDNAGTVETLMEILPNHFVYSLDKFNPQKGTWYCWNLWSQNKPPEPPRWIKNDKPLRKAIMYELEKHWNAMIEPFSFYENMVDEEGEEPNPNKKIYLELKKDVSQYITKICRNDNGINHIVNVAETLMANYNLQFDFNENLFGCENGVIDLNEECFRPYRFDDYVTMSCGYDFRPLVKGFKVFDEKVEENFRKIVETDILPEDTTAFNKLTEIYTQIFPDDEIRNYFFIVNSTALTGKNIEKLFVYNGAGRNGKGLHDEFMEVIIGNYFTYASPIIFSENQKNKTSSGANPEVAKLNKKRYVVMKEPSKDAPLNNNVIKDYTGGGSVSGRALYSSETEVRLHMTCVMECNVKPPFKEEPGDAEEERIVDILFSSKFISDESKWDETTGEINHIYPLNANLKSQDWQDAHKNAMMNILLERLLFLKNDGSYIVDKYTPSIIKDRSLAYLQNSKIIHNLFISIFEMRNESNIEKYKDSKGNKSDDDWTLPKIVQQIRNCPDFNQLCNDKKKEYNASKIKTFFETNIFYQSSIYVDSSKHATMMRGWRLIPREEEEEYEEFEG